MRPLLYSLVLTDQKIHIMMTGTTNLPEVSALQTYSSAGCGTVDLYTLHSCMSVLVKASCIHLGLWNTCTSAHTMQRSSFVRRGMNEADLLQFCVLEPNYLTSLNMWVWVSSFPMAETAVPACSTDWLMRHIFLLAVPQIWDTYSTKFIRSYCFLHITTVLPTCLQLLNGIKQYKE